MKEQITDNFVLCYPKELKDFIQNALAVFEEKSVLIKEIFGEIPDEKIKASFFVDRKSFVDYIRKVSGGHEPPSWAIGCFYNGEIQTLIDIGNENDVNVKKHILTHEFVHLCFNTLIYNKYNISRIRWFDESYAAIIDGSKDNISVLKLKSISNELKSVGSFDVNLLNDSNKVKTQNYNGYDLFLVIGKYIFGNHKEKEFLATLKTNPNKIVDLGKNILTRAIKYIDSL